MWCAWRAGPPNSEGAGAITLPPVDPLRPPAPAPTGSWWERSGGPEALDLVNALNTGHSGSMSTLHATVPPRPCGVWRLWRSSGAGNLPADAIRSQIRSAIDVVIQVERNRRSSPGGGHPILRRTAMNAVAPVGAGLGFDGRHGLAAGGLGGRGDPSALAGGRVVGGTGPWSTPAGYESKEAGAPKRRTCCWEWPGSSGPARGFARRWRRPASDRPGSTSDRCGGWCPPGLPWSGSHRR